MSRTNRYNGVPVLVLGSHDSAGDLGSVSSDTGIKTSGGKEKEGD
jgi:hypothetical protein